MKTENKKISLLIVAALLVGVVLGGLLFKGEKTSDVQENLPEANPVEEKAEVWTCSMHPQIRKEESGECPICGMELIPLENLGDEEGMSDAVKMSPTAMKLAGVETMKVNTGKATSAIPVNGKISYNEQSAVTQTAHIPGRIERLLVDFTGEKVKKGQVLAIIYSPELVTAQEELLQAKKYEASNPALLQAAKSKLKSWKISDARINRVLQSGKPQTQFSILSQVDGIVTQKYVQEGDYIKQGQKLFDVADLSKLWIQFEVYEKDLSKVSVGDSVQFTVDALSSETFVTKITYLDPYVSDKKRVAYARSEIKNKNNKFKPEMFVKGSIHAAEQKEPLQLIVPKSAVMYTGKRSLVYVKKETENGIFFTKREVVLGPSVGKNYVIESGLRSGDEIAVYGTFSIDAAAQVQDKPSMMNQSSQQNVKPKMAISKDNLPYMQQWVDAYLRLKESLTEDDLKTAQKETVVLRQKLNKIDSEQFNEHMSTHWEMVLQNSNVALDQMQKAKNLENFRNEFFSLSNVLIDWVKMTGAYEKELYIQHCPMAHGDGADWISDKKAVENPYYGSSMLKCGEVTTTIK